MDTRKPHEAIETQAARDALREILRGGACKILVEAIENEAAEYVDGHDDLKDKDAHRLVVRKVSRRAAGPHRPPLGSSGAPPGITRTVWAEPREVERR